MSAQERRDQLISSLMDFLGQRDLATLTMQDVAERLGMTKGNLYNYFKNKQDLLYQCHIHAMEGSFRILDTAAKVDGPSRMRLRALVKGLVYSVIRDPYGATLTNNLDSLSPKQRRHYLALRDRFEKGVRAMIQEGVEAGEFETGNVKLAGFALLGSTQWISRWYKPNGSSSPDEIAEFYADLIIRGLQPEKPPARVPQTQPPSRRSKVRPDGDLPGARVSREHQ